MRTQYPAQIVTKSDLIGEDDYVNAMRENRDNLMIQFSINGIRPPTVYMRPIKIGVTHFPNFCKIRSSRNPK